MRRLLVLALIAIAAFAQSGGVVVPPSSGGGGVTSVINDTNIGGSITGSVLTLSWISTLGKARQLATNVFTDQANTYTAGMKQSVQASSTAAGFNFGGVTADPSGHVSGDLWFRNDLGQVSIDNGSSIKRLATVDQIPPVEAHANGAGGTGTNLLASWSASPDPHVASTVVTTPTTNNNGTDNNPEIVGVCVSGCGTSGTGVFQVAGQAGWICDGTVTVGHYVQPSSSTAGQCHDAGAGADLSNENPEGNSMIGIVVTANTGAGTAAQIQLLPFPGYSNAIGGSNHWGQIVQAMGPGSKYLSATYWGQEPTTHSLASDRPIHLYHFNSFYTDIEQTSTLGTSGHDFLLDLLTHAPAWTNLPMFRINGSTYNVPNVQTVTGTVALNVSGTGGNYIWTLSGNTTLSAPTGDNAGHWLSFVIEPPTSGGPFTFTWPAIFKSAPTVSLSAGGTAIAAHCLFDGTNYNCTGSSSGGGGVTSIATTSPITGGTITATGTIACPTCTVTIASGTSALGTSAIASGACATAVTTTATGTATTDVVTASFNGDPTAVTGYIPSTSGMLTIIAYPTANNVNFKTCNNTSASVTPGAITLNWRVAR